MNEPVWTENSYGNSEGNLIATIYTESNFPDIEVRYYSLDSKVVWSFNQPFRLSGTAPTVEKAKRMVIHAKLAALAKELESLSQEQELYHADPTCIHDIKEEWSGIKCTKCLGWNCY